MLFTRHPEGKLSIRKYCGREDVSAFGAFSRADQIRLVLNIPRRMGICEGFLYILDDDTRGETVYPLCFDRTERGDDRYRVDLALRDLCADRSSGLFYCRFELRAGDLTLYTRTENNIDFTLDSTPPEDRQSTDGMLRLLVYDRDFCVPEWFSSCVMYHLFVDRFSKGGVPVKKRPDARINTDWENGVPEYGDVPGADIPNNTFFGGTLYGVCEKLDYLLSMGVNCLYLSPIFKAFSNHKYDTGDYLQIDEMFGGREAFDLLLCECGKRGIRVILDGVFNHTGNDSRYFNQYGKYDTVGAYQSQDSPYYDWYFFKEFPDEYQCWWDIKILPKLNLENAQCRNFFLGENGVVEHYLKKGVSGFRLDVADELSDGFLEDLRARAKQGNPDTLIIGEVWENAADKISYGRRRKFLRGRQLDSVMNYPLREAIIHFVKSGDCGLLSHTVTALYASYPKFVSDSLMNILGTHDTERILTSLAGEERAGKTMAQLSRHRLTKEQRKIGIARLKLASALQFTLPGVPSVYYGDEAGMEGYGDPFCRMPYPWGGQENELMSHYKALCAVKRGEPALWDGTLRVLSRRDGLFVFERYKGTQRVLVAANGAEREAVWPLDGEYTDLLRPGTVMDRVTIGACEAKILKRRL